ncbi:MAG: glycoside hydrolase family 97 catalytic domain-containing protein, partial [Ignavibacteria bacterium]|nr:glycoside hydrolase family 97 catalytic domain-containing protein [Ignavibacteria bacterium]
FRAFNEGVAYRFEASLEGDMKVNSETYSVNFAGDYLSYFPEEESFMSHNERVFNPIMLKDIKEKQFASTPSIIDTKEGTLIGITESDLEDYPGLWLKGTAQNSLTGIFPASVLEAQLKRDRDLMPTKRADYLALTKGTRAFPWRIFAITNGDGDLITNEMVYLLSKPNQLKDISWIKPGKVAWDWWNFNNIYNVDFRAGVNTETYKYFIDFASKYGIEYIILDEGWYKLGDLLSVEPEMNVREIINYGKQKNVGVILWVVWKTLDDQLQPALDLFEKWGAKGIKVDFMQRDDQEIVNYYWKIAREAAKRKLLVDFHGAFKPSGLLRAYPNVITNEGVKGLENDKWESLVTPEHCVTLPFTRMFAGPIDFTPGAMVNVTKASFKPMFTQPTSMGTRCQQLAMYVVYESPLQMLADNPTNYYREPRCMEFLSKVPSVWDKTIVLDAKIADYVLLARQSGNDWYVGAMTDDKARDFIVDFSFLDNGTYTADIWQDGINADRNGNDFKKISVEVSNTTKLNIHLAPGGGWTARVYKK